MVGERILHYQVEELLGSGGMGVVYRASDVRLGRPVALKILKSELTTDTDRRKRFFQEARTASSVTHPAIAQVYDVGEEDGVIFMAMEFVAGSTVRELIRSRDVDLLGALEIGIQVADGLARAHREGLVHRDIKSDNIMVTPDGHTKILDFGLAKLLATTPARESGQDALSEVETMAQTQIGTVLGTVAYMSPEQARGREVDHRSDIFSLGVVLYEMVTGELPFKGDSPLDTMHAVAFEEVQPVTIIRRNLPPNLQQIISQCLRKRADSRYNKAEDLSNDLKSLKREIESGVQSSLSPLTRRQRVSEWIRDSLPSGWAGLGAAALVAGSVGYLLMSRLDIATVIIVLLIGLPTYRFVRNRRRRMLKRFTNRISRYPEVHLIAVRDNRITVVAYSASGALYQEVSTLVDRLNQKQFYGAAVTAAVRDDLDTDELRQLLRDPGLTFVRDELVQHLQSGAGRAVSEPAEDR